MSKPIRASINSICALIGLYAGIAGLGLARKTSRLAGILCLTQVGHDVRAKPAPLFRGGRGRAALRACSSPAEHDAAAAQPSDPAPGARARCKPVRAHQPLGPAGQRRLHLPARSASSSSAGRERGPQRQTDSPRQGSVAIGFTTGSSYSFVPRLVTLAKTEMPDVDLVLKEMRTVEQMEALASNRIDLGLLRLPIDRRRVDVVCIHSVSLDVGCARRSPTSRQGGGRGPGCRSTAFCHVFAGRRPLLP